MKLIQLTKKKKTKIHKIRHEKREVTTNNKEIKAILNN